MKINEYIEYTKMEISKRDSIVDNILNELILNQAAYSEGFKFLELEKHKDINLQFFNDYMLLNGLIIKKYTSNKIFILTQKGYDIREKGGWVKYQEKIVYNKKRKRIKGLISYWFAIIIPILALVATVYSLKITENYQHQKSEDKEYIKEIELKIKKVENNQKETIEIQNRILKEIDSLNTLLD